MPVDMFFDVKIGLKEDVVLLEDDVEFSKEIEGIFVPFLLATMVDWSVSSISLLVIYTNALIETFVLLSVIKYV